MPLDESGWPAPFSRWDVAVQTHPSSSARDSSAISQAACYNAAMVYVPVVMLPGAEVDDDSMFVEPFHRGAWLRLGWPRAPEYRGLPFVQMDGDAMFEPVTPSSRRGSKPQIARSTDGEGPGRGGEGTWDDDDLGEEGGGFWGGFSRGGLAHCAQAAVLEGERR